MTAASPRLHGPPQKRADFLAAARGIRRVAGAMTLELAPTPDTSRRPRRLARRLHRQPQDRQCRRPQPRQAAAARRGTAQLPLLGRPGHDYVLVARAGDPDAADFEALLGDLAEALGAAHAKLDAGQETGA